MTTVTRPGSTAGGALVTEFRFELPIGYVDASQQVHKTGTMRLATARDEILPLRDSRVRDNEAYLTVLLLSRVITQLGELDDVTPAVIEGLFTADLGFLQDLYQRINRDGHTLADVHCPVCDHPFAIDLAGDVPGES